MVILHPSNQTLRASIQHLSIFPYHLTFIIQHFVLRVPSLHIDHKPVLHIRLQYPFIRFIHLVHTDDLHIGNDIVLSAEIKHLLRFADAAN